jgi:hypothetical protein
MDYTKLSNLIGDNFTIEKIWGFRFKKWDNDNKKMLTSEKYEQGYRKLYEVDTDKGKMDLGSGQVGTLLEAVFKDGTADLNGKTFEVKSNGKEGMEIRYFFNEVKDVKPLPDKEVNGEYDLESIPF